MKTISSHKLIIIALTGALIYSASSCRSKYPTTTDNFVVNKLQADPGHGKALLLSSCGGCHYSHDVNSFIGKPMSSLPKIMGRTYSANLTTSEKYSPVPHYTDSELAYLIRTGITREGHFIPYMLRPNMSDSDLRDLISYLRSGEGPVAPADTSVGHTKLNFIGKIAIHLIGKPQPYIRTVVHPSSQTGLGKYLVDNIGCFHCHSRKLTAANYLLPENTKGYLAGGTKFKIPGGGKMFSPNITMDKETGIGYFNAADFRQAVLHMKVPGNIKLRPPMEAFELTNDEANAIYAYINTLNPVHHEVKGQPGLGPH